jgi:hypothetical protein
VLHPAGFEVDGKANGIRVVLWSICGPLKEWINAYPPAPGLWREATGMAAEKAFAPTRKKHGLTQDILRHTALSAMCHAPSASFAQVALAAGNSEAMIRRHYLGRWTPEMTQALYAIKPAKTPPPALQNPPAIQP